MTKHKNRFFNAANRQNTLTLSMYDTIGPDYDGGGITAALVQAAINQGDYTSITVRLNSPGGSAFEGVTIYNVLRSSGKPINVIVDGLAASAASIILMAGDTRTVNAGGVVMIHEAQVFAMGNAADMRKTADTLDTVTASIADIYVARTGVAKDEVLSLMQAETWMSSDEALANGFATAVASDKSAVKNSFDLSKFRNTPKTLINEAPDPDPDEDGDVDDPCACSCVECQAGDCANCSCSASNCVCPVEDDADEDPEKPEDDKEEFDNVALLKLQLAINKRK